LTALLGSVAVPVKLMAVPAGSVAGKPVNEAVGATLVAVTDEDTAALVNALSLSVAVKLTVYEPPYSGVKLKAEPVAVRLVLGPVTVQLKV
jgi:hypothetical protein